MVGIAYRGASQSRLYADWNAQATDPNDDWANDAATLAARGWSIYQNDGFAHALVETLVGGVNGPDGLHFRSLYAVDEEADTTDAERATRRKIEAGVRRATWGTRLDASSSLTKREFVATIYRSYLITGDGIAIRVGTQRPDAFTFTAWRVIDPSRVSNPNHAPDSDRYFEGFELDAVGTPIAIHIQATHPNLSRTSPKLSWIRIPIFGDDGSRNVIHLKRTRRPDQIRGIGIYAPMLTQLRHLYETAESWVVAKRLQASIGLIVKCDDPSAAARSDRNGALLNGTVGIKPGMKYYAPREWDISPLNFSFQGSDFEMFRNPILEVGAASAGLPFEFVLHRLTKSNLASSRAALLLAYQTFKREQAEVIAHIERPIVESIVRELVNTGRIDPGGVTDWDLILRGRWLRPPTIWPDPLKEAQAAKAWADLQRSLSGIFADAGYDFAEEVMQRAQDDDFMRAQGINFGIEAIGERIVTEPRNPSPAAEPDGSTPDPATTDTAPGDNAPGDAIDPNPLDPANAG